MLREFFPDVRDGMPGAPKGPTVAGTINRQTNRNLAGIRSGSVAPIGGAPSPDDLRNQAAMLALRKRAQATPHPSISGDWVGALNQQADTQEAEERLALAQTARDMAAGARRDVGTSPIVNPYTGVRADNQLDTLNQMAGSRLAGAAALGKSAPFEQGSDRPLDPRLTTQGRTEYGRIGASNAEAHGAMIRQALNAADHEAARIKEQQRIQTEGDTWNRQNAQKSQALLALGTRGARDY